MARRPDPTSRTALVDAARGEFARRGLHAARIEDITAACGLSKGSFYLHFPSKESLFAELVKEFEKGMDACYRARRKLTEELLADGPLTRADIARASPRYRAFRAMEEEEDLRALELMWQFRDVVSVLISGAQGTPFDGLLWKLIEREAARVATEFRGLQSQGTCRTDVPPEIFGAMIVGTYLLLAHRLAGMAEKPDLREWSRSLQNLVQQGSSESAQVLPRAARQAPRARTAAGKTARKTDRKPARPSPRSSP